MDETFAFSKQYEYDTLKIGVTVPVTLRLNGDTVDFEAKVHTGAENCIFEKIHGERPGLVIELGREQNFSTPTGTFTAYGHELTINVLEIEFVSTVYFAKEESFTRNVPGRQGWLDRVKLGLIDYEGKLFLSEYNKQVSKSLATFWFSFRVHASACFRQRSAAERQSAFRVWTLNQAKYLITFAHLLK